MLNDTTCLIVIVNQSKKKKMTVASINLQYIMQNFNKGKRSYAADFSNVLYLIATDKG